MKAVSSRTMRELDEMTIAGGTPGETLMERAGTGAFDQILGWLENIATSHVVMIVVVTGKGNNGGDGHVLARLFAEHTEYPVTVFSTCSRKELKGDARLNADRLPEAVEFMYGDELPDELLTPGTLLIDALLGTGIKGAVQEPYATIIRAMNESGLPICAIDLPSGLNADDGSVANVAIRADLTLTMGLPKMGLLLGEGLAHCGQLRCIDIGLDAGKTETAMSPFDAVFAADARAFLKRLPVDAHKGSMGRVLIVGGARSYPGAPMLAGRGALRAGGGLVSVAFPESMIPLARPKENALILHPLDDQKRGHHCLGEELMELAKSQDVLAVGPGLSRADEALDVVAALLGTGKAVVLDADGLSVFSRHPSVLPRQGLTVLTPHPGEMKRLLQAIGEDELAEKDRLTQAGELARRFRCFVVLKGAGTVITSPEGDLAINSSGTAGLATGGTGDVLTGILAAFLAQSDDPWLAIRSAIFLHGLAAELAPNGRRHLIADDLPDLLGEAMHSISPFA